MSSAEEGFVAFREPVDRKVFALGFVLWARTGAMLRRVLRIVVNLPDRGDTAEELAPEFFRYPGY